MPEEQLPTEQTLVTTQPESLTKDEFRAYVTALEERIAYFNSQSPYRI